MAQQNREGGDGAMFCPRVNIVFQVMLHLRMSDESIMLHVKEKGFDN